MSRRAEYGEQSNLVRFKAPAALSLTAVALSSFVVNSQSRCAHSRGVEMVNSTLRVVLLIGLLPPR